MGNMHRPIFVNWHFVQSDGRKIQDKNFKSGILSNVQERGKMNCRGMNISVQGKLREDSDYELDNHRPHQVMALKKDDAGIIALTETYSEIILA